MAEPHNVQRSRRGSELDLSVSMVAGRSAWLVWLTAGQGLTFHAARYLKLARRVMNKGPV